jgi:putative hydrolase of the HAD superfamily
MATRAVFLDALGTLVALEPPAPRLAAALGIPLDERVERAMSAEMAYYREHAHEGGDEASLAELRARCAEVVSGELGVDVGVETLMVAIRFRAYDDAAPALTELRARGIARVCVSNWDCSLPRVLDRVGLGELLDGVVTSATSRSRKPDAGIFKTALELAGCGPPEALHVGDTELEDVAGATAAGIPALLLVREARAGPRPDAVAVMSSLIEISDHLRP